MSFDLKHNFRFLSLKKNQMFQLINKKKFATTIKTDRNNNNYQVKKFVVVRIKNLAISFRLRYTRL